MNKRVFMGVIFLLALLLTGVPQPASAEPVITIDAEAGWDGKAKYGEGLPVRFTITNSGTDFAGDLLMMTTEGYNLNHTAAIPVVLAQGETKTIQVSSPGGIDVSYMPTGSNQNIFLYEGGWEDGKRINFKGTKTLQTQFFEPTAFFLATLSSNSDRLAGLEELTIPGRNPVEVFHLNQLEDFILPSDSSSWQAIDALLIDEVAFSDLPQQVQAAVFEWVQQGGHLIVGSSDTVSAEMGDYAAYLPLQLGSLSNGTDTPFTEEIPVYEATAAEGAEVLLGNEGSVLAGSMAVGAGAVVQTAFSLGDQNIAEQLAYPITLQKLLKVPTSSNPWMGESVKNYLGSEMSMVNELFDSFNISQPFMIVIVFIYILLVVPVLYIILKRKDKREYAWVIIPAIAVLASIGIFVYGAKDRITNPQIQQIGFFEADAGGGLKGYYMSSVLTNRAGDYTFTAPSGTTMTNYTNMNPVSDISRAAIAEREGDRTKLTIQDLRNWSVSSVIGDSYIPDAGNLAIDVSIDGDLLTGTVRNNFPFALQDVSIWSGTQLIPLGDLAPSEELVVSETMRSAFLAPASPIMSQGNYYSIQSPEDLQEERRYLTMDLMSTMVVGESTEPLIVGYAEDALVPVTLEGGRTSVESLHLIGQKFQPGGTVSGEFALDRDTLPHSVSSTGNGYFENYSEDPYLYWFESGQYEIVYELPDTLNTDAVNWNLLEVSGNLQEATLSIFNFGSEEFEALTDGTNSYTDTAASYIDTDGLLRFQLDVPSTISSEITIPQIKMEGVIGQ